MSLLIDALKQAEAARAQAQSGESPDTAGGIELEPLAEHKTSSAPSPAGGVRQGVTPTPAQEVRRTRPVVAPSGVVASNAARELFEVKRQAPNRLPLILAGVGIALFLIGSGYVWWAIQPRSSLMAPGLRAAGMSSQAAVALPPVPGVPAIAPDVAPAATPSPTAATQAIAAAARTDIIPPRRERREMFRTAPLSNEHTSASLPDDTKQQIRSGAPAAADISGIQAAYTAYLEGNYALARQRYQEVLRQDPRNIDAMNALGLIAWRSGQPDVAERMFRAAVRADPKDATAMSQLTLLYAEGDAAAAEGRLRNLIASQPNSGAAYYALGSLLARQERWNEAQQALFQAYTLDSDNPDVLFNLAVSLEHLAQPGAARQFYERALQAAARRPAGFDKSVAQGRVLALGSR